MMDFGQALRALKDGARLARSGWNGKNMFIELQRPDSKSKMTQPYVYISAAQGDLIPWVVSQSDLLSQDWLIVE